MREAIRGILGSLGTFCTSHSVGRMIVDRAATAMACLREKDADIEACEGHVALAEMMASYWNVQEVELEEAPGKLLFHDLVPRPSSDQVKTSRTRILCFGVDDKTVAMVFDLLTQTLALALGKLLPPPGVSYNSQSCQPCVVWARMPSTDRFVYKRT